MVGLAGVGHRAVAVVPVTGLNRDEHKLNRTYLRQDSFSRPPCAQQSVSRDRVTSKHGRPTVGAARFTVAGMTVIGADSTPDLDGVSGAESPERLVALSDGIYAIAMTLLVLDLSIPSGLSEAGFRHAMHQVWPNLGSYALSFAILAALWRDQRWLLHQLRRVDALTVRLSLAGLGAVALVPFPTALLSEYGAREPLAVSAYTAAIALINLLHLTLFLTVWRRRHLQARPIPDHVGRVTVAELVRSS